MNKKCKGVLELSNQKADEVENEDLDVETIVQEQVDVDCVRCTTYKKRELHI